MTVHKRLKKKLRRPLMPLPHKKANTLAVCMIVKNEEKCLPYILSDIQGLADELIIVDTGSTDETITIAQKMGARVVSQAWTGDFSAARNRSKDEATANWILWLDADDRIEPEEVKSLQSLKHTLKNDCVYSLQVISKIADGFSPPFMQTRLFPNDPRLKFENRIHESITMSAKKHGFRGVNLPVKIIHTGYEKPEQLLQKMERNIYLLEKELAEKPEAFSLRFLYANTLLYFNRFKEAQVHYELITTMPGARETQSDVYNGALVAMAHTHNQLKNYQEALIWAQRAVEDRPQGPQGMQGWYQWGYSLIHLNESEAALEKFHHALACKNTISSVQVDYSGLRMSCLEAIATILVSLGRSHEAENILKDEFKKEATPGILELLGKVQNKPISSEEDLLCKGQELLTRKAYIEASKIFIRVIETNPRNFQAFNGLGVVSWYFGKYDDAYVLFRKAVEVGPEIEDILLNLWDAAQKIGQGDEAQIVLQEALNRKPGMIKIKELLKR